MYIVGFVGPAGSGKTTLINHINNSIPSTILSCNGHLYRVVSEMFGIDCNNLKNNKDGLTNPKIQWEREHLTYGRLMQIFGTEIGRTMMPDVWSNEVDRMISQVKSYSDPKYRNPDLILLIDSVRFKNEAAVIRKHGGSLVGLERKGQSATRDRNHRSETEMWEIEIDEIWANNDLNNITAKSYYPRGSTPAGDRIIPLLKEYHAE